MKRKIAYYALGTLVAGVPWIFMQGINAELVALGAPIEVLFRVNVVMLGVYVMYLVAMFL